MNKMSNNRRQKVGKNRHLLEALGLEVNSFFLADDTIEGIRHAGSASLNIVISHSCGLEAAGVFEEVHGTPYVSQPLPVGASATESFLRVVGKRRGQFQADGVCHQ